MDHLPYPQDPACPPIEIPYICAELEEYDGLDFINYPVRRGWAQVAHSAHWMDCPWETAAKRAQNWLYFGLLREVIGPSYKKKVFLRRNSNNNGYVIDTSKLPGIFRDWSRSVLKNRYKLFRSKRDPELSKKRHDIFCEVNLQSERLDQRLSYCRIITLGIKVLLESLQIVYVGFTREDEECISEINHVAPARLLYFKMVSSGWCLSQALWLPRDYGPIIINYLAALPRRFVGLDHKGCDAEACIANNVNENTYETTHTSESCQCEFRGPDEVNILELIKKDCIPLISVAIMSDNTPRIDLVKAEPGVKYTAISHVWSGGLGNPRENKLPRCQLLKIYALLAKTKRRELPKRKSTFELLWHRFSIWRKNFCWKNLALGSQPGYLPLSMEFSEYQENKPMIFWIDTLCVPVGKHNKPYRIQAIRSMDLIYASAENTLVLDSELQQISQTSQEQMSAHVLCSSWMARCWTLQEARLSQRCYVQFADQLFDIQNASKLALDDWNDEIRICSLSNLKYLRWVMILWYYTMLPMRDPLYDMAYEIRSQFSNEWNNLVQRSTSRKGDIYCIFASMLGLNGGDILALPHEQRMKAIIRAQKRLPLDLLFVCPKMDDESCRWIPSYPGLGVPIITAYGEMKICTEGVIFDRSTANYVGFSVASSKPRLDRFCLREHSNSDPVWVTVNSDGTNADFETSTSIATCYIFGKIGDTNGRKPLLFDNGLIQLKGARFAVQRREGHVLHLSYECSVKYQRSRPCFYDSEGRYVVDQSDFPLLEAEVLHADKVFQIDCGKSFHEISSDIHSHLIHEKKNA